MIYTYFTDLREYDQLIVRGDLDMATFSNEFRLN
jgi:hypothetical protein